MSSKLEIPFVEYHKMRFYFCSEQCRETFNARPNLYQIKPQEKQKEIIKQRIIHLSKPLGDAGSELLSAYLTALMGIKKVVIESDKVNVTYDLLQVTEMQIKDVLTKIGIQLGDNWLERFRLGWVQNSEENELDNLAPPSRSYIHISSKNKETTP